MALPITELTRSLIANSVKTPQLILEIDGLPLFGSTPTGIYAKYDDEIFYDQAGLYYDGIISDPNSFPYIDLDKSTNSITQQLLVDQGGYSSATTFDVALVDKNQEITRILKPNEVVEDILGRKARLYLAFDGGGHPVDSILFFSGNVQAVSAGAGYVKINLASPEKLKNLDIFPLVSTELTSAINASAATINVQSTEDFTLPADGTTLETYLLIDDEIIKYTGKTSTSFTGCVRGQFGTIADAHDIESNAEIRYRLQGNLRDLCLKLMLSAGDEFYVKDQDILAFNSYGLDTVTNSVFVAREDFQRFNGVVIGDTATITGALNAGNNGSAVILNIQSIPTGSYITLDKTLVNEGSGALLSIKSKYNVLPKFVGLEMSPDQVDVEEFETKYQQFSASFFEYDFFLSDQVKGGEFINQQILYPSGAYALPRKAKTSLGLTIPPLAQAEIKKLSNFNVVNADKLVISRSTSNNFYNAIVYKYDKDQVEDKYKRGKIRQSADSTNRIKIANKPLTIISDGVRSESNFEGKFNIQARRFLERYQYGAESITIETQLNTGFTVEIGDTIILDGSALQISDSTEGSRQFKPRLFEVQNKTLSLKGQAVKLTLVDTAFNLNGRYGVFSKSSKVDTGSTTTTINIKKSFGNSLKLTTENFRWTNLVGSKIRIRSKDYTYDHEVTLVGLNPADDSSLLIEPALPTAPQENYIVDVSKYATSTDPQVEALSKAMHCFWNNQASVLTGISQTQFTINISEQSEFGVGYVVKIHDDSYTVESVEAKITDVTGTTITVDRDLGFTPSVGQKIELLGYVDGGAPYRWL